MTPFVRATGPAIMLALAGSLFFSSDSQAITAEEVMDRMTPEEAGSFMAGAIDMYAQQNPNKAICAQTWFNEQDGSTKTFKIFLEFPDKPAVAVMDVLIRRVCK